MKKFIFMVALMIATTFSANAQVATENSKTFDNVYVTVNGGVATPLDFNNVFPLNGIAGLAVGKQFTPVVGAEVEGSAWFGSHATGTHKFGVPHFDSAESHNIVRGTYLGLNGTVNLTNWFRGYVGAPRTFEMGVLAGLGWNHMFTPNESNAADNTLGAKTGLDFMFNLGKTKAHTISIRPAVLWNLSTPGNSYGNLAFNKLGAQFYLGVGYTYHFKTSNGTRHFKTYNVGEMMATIDRLNDELAKKPKEVVNTVVKEVPVKEVVTLENGIVFFAFDSAELDERAKAELDKLGQNGVYVVDAWASNEGSTEYNLGLSQRRANAVREYLEGRGCRVDSAVGHGVQFGTTTGRVAIVTTK